MKSNFKTLKALTPEDLTALPVWEFALDMERIDEMAVRPVAKLPVNDLINRVVGTKVRLAGGSEFWSLIQNIDLNNPARTKHLLALSVLSNGKWFSLARYHDSGRQKYGPAALAKGLGLGINDVFPIMYDVSNCCIGDENSVRGSIESDPKDKLSRDDIVRLASGFS